MKKHLDIEGGLQILLTFVLLMSVGPFLFAQQGDPPNRGFASIKQVLDRSCAACHDWTASYEKIVGGGHVVPKEPEKSTLYQMIANDTMPMTGPKLTADEKALIENIVPSRPKK